MILQNQEIIKSNKKDLSLSARKLDREKIMGAGFKQQVSISVKYSFIVYTSIYINTYTYLYKNAYIAHNGLNNFIFSNEYFSFYDNKY